MTLCRLIYYNLIALNVAIYICLITSYSLYYSEIKKNIYTLHKEIRCYKNYVLLLNQSSNKVNLISFLVTQTYFIQHGKLDGFSA